MTKTSQWCQPEEDWFPIWVCRFREFVVDTVASGLLSRDLYIYKAQYLLFKVFDK